jgi:RND family efflux transporter MFP subunit
MKPHVLSLLSLALLAACSPHTPPQAPPSAVVAEPAPIHVTTRAAEEKSMPRYLRITGQLKGSQEAMVAADAAGKVIEAPVERGSIVKAGDVLIKLDERSAELALKEAEASMATAQLRLDLSSDELKRNAPLAASKAISDTDFQRLKNERLSADANLAAAVARRDSAKKTVNDATIRAPFAGTVAERLTDLGEYVRVDSQVVHLVAIEQLHLWLNVPETSVGAITAGQSVTFSVPAYPGEIFTATVKFIGSSVRETARDLIVEAEVPNREARLKPGMFAEGRLALGEATVITVPVKSLRVEGSTRKVLIVQGEHLEERLVEIGETKGDAVEIRRGVQKGDAVVITPSAEAVDGIKVTLASQP